MGNDGDGVVAANTESDVSHVRIGPVTHNYERKGVIAIKATQRGFKLNDTIRIEKIGTPKGESDFIIDQAVTSIEIDHQPVTEVKKGQEAAVKVKCMPPNNAKAYIVIPE